ncbi:hypothetical protein M4951_22735 [Blastopirellula sp. J2-11]|uniref:hypothetical protein n=1 Tax=Blastopirellula sp. J2-11 TaxID=2943192 RepID=UPI0021C82882|nr:hypothetical protein [Blastopirellula sp. J2-11]UUO06162.1 hypothetical protein M4951_22735 [Blastopirellula sp. J2-11]
MNLRGKLAGDPVFRSVMRSLPFAFPSSSSFYGNAGVNLRLPDLFFHVANIGTHQGDGEASYRQRLAGSIATVDGDARNHFANFFSLVASGTGHPSRIARRTSRISSARSRGLLNRVMLIGCPSLTGRETPVIGK